MQTALRYLVMLQHIPRQPQKIDPASLREKLYSHGFQVSVRTIQRDLNDLSEVFPLVTDERSKPYGWSFLADSPISLPSLDMPTALALLLMEQQLERLLPNALMRKLQANFNAARKLLDDQTSGYERWLERVRVLPPRIQLKPAEFDPLLLDTVYQAIEQQLQLLVTYHSRSKRDERSFSVSPLGIIQRGAVTYLVCQFNGYEHFRHLALQRIIDVSLSKARSLIPADMTLQHHLDSGALNLNHSDVPETVVLRFKSEVGNHLYETPLSEDQTIVADGDEHLCIHATVAISDEFIWWLLGFGARVEVLAPASLRQELRGQIQAMNRCYEDG